MDDEQYKTPEEEAKKRRRKILFLLIILFLPILYYIWFIFLDFGKVMIHGEAPFKAEIFGGETFYCNDSPCEIKQKTGTAQLIVSKENFQQNLMEIDFKLWAKSDYTAIFKVNPYIEKTDTIPEKDKEFSYDIMFDDETKSYKLFDKSDAEKIALTYFPEEIKNPKIFGSKYSVIIVRSTTSGISRGQKSTISSIQTQEAYLVNLSTKTKTPLPDFDFSFITEWKFSPDGSFFQFQTSDSNYWWTMDLSQKTISTPTPTKIENTLKTDWIYGNKIVFISQNFSANIYDLRQDKFENLGTFSEMKEYPLNIIAGANGGVIYIETKNQKFRIILR